MTKEEKRARMNGQMKQEEFGKKVQRGSINNEKESIDYDSDCSSHDSDIDCMWSVREG